MIRPTSPTGRYVPTTLSRNLPVSSNTEKTGAARLLRTIG